MKHQTMTAAPPSDVPIITLESLSALFANFRRPVLDEDIIRAGRDFGTRMLGGLPVARPRNILELVGIPVYEDSNLPRGMAVIKNRQTIVQIIDARTDEEKAEDAAMYGDPNT